MGSALGEDKRKRVLCMILYLLWAATIGWRFFSRFLCKLRVAACASPKWPEVAFCLCTCLKLGEIFLSGSAWPVFGQDRLGNVYVLLHTGYANAGQLAKELMCGIVYMCLVCVQFALLCNNGRSRGVLLLLRN